MYSSDIWQQRKPYVEPGVAPDWRQHDAAATAKGPRNQESSIILYNTWAILA
jgi:hypothetical protein